MLLAQLMLSLYQVLVIHEEEVVVMLIMAVPLPAPHLFPVQLPHPQLQVGRAALHPTQVGLVQQHPHLSQERMEVVSHLPQVDKRPQLQVEQLAE